MSTMAAKKPAQTSFNGASSNPFARALAETEKSAYDQQGSSAKPLEKNPFSDALARAGGSFNPWDAQSQNPMAWQEKQRLQLIEQQKREALRKKLHDQINPVDQRDLFSAREKKVKEEIEKLRDELKLLVKDVAKFNKEVEVTLMTETVSPGQDGKYYINFFRQLRAFIMLLRQKIKSARTWATQLNGKKAKKKKGPLMFEGKKGGHTETSVIYEMMHHEVSNARSGG